MRFIMEADGEFPRLMAMGFPIRNRDPPACRPVLWTNHLLITKEKY